MTVSVLIPIHNGEKTLKRAIDSILEQTTKDSIKEIICVLNNCTDKTEETIIRTYFGLGINIFKQNQFKGIVPTLNFGLQRCTGELIARMDADDYWYPNKLKEQLEFLENNSSVDILGTQIRIVKKESFEPTGIVSKNPIDDTSIKQSLFNSINPIAHPSVIFKRNILLQLGGYSNMFPLCEDMDLWLRASKFFTFANLPDVLVDYTESHNPEYTPISPQLAAYNMKQILQYFPRK